MQCPIYELAVSIHYGRIFSNAFTEENQSECRIKWADFVQFCEQYKLTPAEYPTVEGYSNYSRATEHAVVLLQASDALALLAAHPNDVQIRSVINVDLDPAKIFESVSSKAEAACVGGSAVYNTKCDVHMPGQALSTYNEVQLLEDSCTDVLQAQMAAGWRLIAACPQPDQRRPDYILGRFNPEYNGDSVASRGN